jgi:hypothetical protein
MQTTRVDDARVRELTPVRGPLQVKPIAASAMSAERATLTPPAAVRDRTVVATRTPRDFSPALRAQGLGAEREAPQAASPRIVPAPKRTVTVTPPENQRPGPRPRAGDVPNTRRPEPSSAPSTAPAAPRPGSRAAPAQPESGQTRRPPADETEGVHHKAGPPPPPPRSSAEARQGRPHGVQQQQQRRPEAKQGQPPQQRSGERAPEAKEKQPEK